MKSGTFIMLSGASLLVMASAAEAQSTQRAPATQLASMPAPPAPDAAGTAPAAGDEERTGVIGETGGDIIVTARRRDEALRDVPQTINVVTAAQIEKLNLRTFADIQAVVPGLQLERTAAFSSRATVRGVAFVPEASGNNPSVEFYVDDSIIASNFLFNSLFDIGQFELLRGPQGTLRGRASPSGSITLTTRRPDMRQPGISFNGTVTDKHAYQGWTAINVPIIRDILAVRVAGVVDKDQFNRVHTIKQETDPSHNASPFRDTKALRASVQFEPTDSLNFNFMYQTLTNLSLIYAQVESASLVTGAAPDGSRIIRPRDFLAIEDQGTRSRLQLQDFVWNADFRFAGQRLSYVGSHNIQDIVGSLGPSDGADYFAPPRFNIVDRTLNDPVFPDPNDKPCQYGVMQTFATITNGTYYQCTHSRAIRNSHELRLASEERVFGFLDYVIGGFYDHNENPTRLTNETPVVLAINPPRLVALALTPILRDSHSTEKSVFGHLAAHIGEATEIAGGLRYIDFRSFSSLIVSGGKPGPDVIDHSHATIFTLSAKHKFSDNLMVYANAGSSWRPGVFAVGDFSVVQSAREQSFLHLPPETSKSYEIGFKASFLNHRGSFNIDAYHQNFKNYPFRTSPVFYVNSTLVGTAISPGVSSFNFVAAVPVKVDGVEADAGFQITPRWSISGSFSYANGRFRNALVPCNDLNGDGVPDASPATPTLAQLQAVVGANNLSQCRYSGRSIQAPKWNATLQSEAGVPLTQGADGFIRGLVSYSTHTKNDPNNIYDDVRAYALVNLYAGVRDPHGAWELSLFAKNIFNTEVVLNRGAQPLTSSIRTTSGTLNFSAPYFSINRTAPREVGLNLRLAVGSR